MNSLNQIRAGITGFTPPQAAAAQAELMKAQAAQTEAEAKMLAAENENNGYAEGGQVRANTKQFWQGNPQKAPTVGQGNPAPAPDMMKARLATSAQNSAKQAPQLRANMSKPPIPQLAQHASRTVGATAPNSFSSPSMAMAGATQVLNSPQNVNQVNGAIAGLKNKAGINSDSTPYPQLGKAADYAQGGLIEGPGTGTSDSIPATIPEETFIIPENVVEYYGLPYLEKLRALADPEGQSEDLAEGNEEVDVNVSNGEFQFTPEEVAVLGADFLNNMIAHVTGDGAQPEMVGGEVYAAKGYAPYDEKDLPQSELTKVKSTIHNKPDTQTFIPKITPEDRAIQVKSTDDAVRTGLGQRPALATVVPPKINANVLPQTVATNNTPPQLATNQQQQARQQVKNTQTVQPAQPGITRENGGQSIAELSQQQTRQSTQPVPPQIGKSVGWADNGLRTDGAPQVLDWNESRFSNSGDPEQDAALQERRVGREQMQTQKAMTTYDRAGRVAFKPDIPQVGGTQDNTLEVAKLNAATDKEKNAIEREKLQQDQYGAVNGVDAMGNPVVLPYSKKTGLPPEDQNKTMQSLAELYSTNPNEPVDGKHAAALKEWLSTPTGAAWLKQFKANQKS
ncbi:MAG: hypothetical protein WC856_27800 [Methylococcaceae bacterium]|jgi:hypothetical protein